MSALIWIDATPLLTEARARLRATQAKLSTAEDRVRLHKQTDEPEYQRWFNATFSERLGEIRELYEKLAELDTIVWEVEREILATGCSAIEAYANVMAAKLVPKSEEPEEADDETSDEEDGSFEQTQFHESDAAENQKRAGERDFWKPTAKKPPTDETIKQIYRQLVRKLHPDLNPDLPESLRERWFEVQEAYDDRDLTRLEKLLALCEDGNDDESFIDRIQSLSRLKLLMKSVAKKLKTSQRQLTKLKNAPAWNFHKTKKDPRKLRLIEREVVYELNGTEGALLGDIRTLEAQIRRWQAPPPSKNRKARSKRDWNLSLDY